MISISLMKANELEALGMKVTMMPKSSVGSLVQSETLDNLVGPTR